MTECSGSGFVQCLDNSTSKNQHNILSMTEKCYKQIEYQANLDDMNKKWCMTVSKSICFKGADPIKCSLTSPIFNPLCFTTFTRSPCYLDREIHIYLSEKVHWMTRFGLLTAPGFLRKLQIILLHFVSPSTDTRIDRGLLIH